MPRTVVDRRGGGAPGMRSPLGPNSFIFMQLSGRVWPNNRLAPLPWMLAPPPYTGNPKSATERQRAPFDLLATEKETAKQY